MYKDISTTEEFPKTLIIRNHEGGLIWQIYHVTRQLDVENLSNNASRSGFQAITLEDHQPDLEETWPDWEQTKIWQ